MAERLAEGLCNSRHLSENRHKYSALYSAPIAFSCSLSSGLKRGGAAMVSVDFSTSASLQLSQELDPSGQRTLLC